MVDDVSALDDARGLRAIVRMIRRLLISLALLLPIWARAQDNSTVVASTTSTQDCGLFGHLLPHLLLSRSGPLGPLGLLFTPVGMVIAQMVLVVPIVAALSRQMTEDLWAEHRDLIRADGLSPIRAAAMLLWIGRFSLVTTVLAGLGRALAEVGAILIVGGNIAGATRTMTTAISLETSKGDLALALGLGIVLLTLTLTINGMAHFAREATRRLG
jgi:tungstate transport system permease protein